MLDSQLYPFVGCDALTLKLAATSLAATSRTVGGDIAECSSRSLNGAKFPPGISLPVIGFPACTVKTSYQNDIQSYKYPGARDGAHLA
jgi:hypothetical protein